MSEHDHASQSGLPFAIAMRGYDREQVSEFFKRSDAEMRVIAADRDAAAANTRELAEHLDDARDEIEQLRRDVDSLSVPVSTAQGMSDRISRMLQLAADEASEMRATAQSEAAELLSVARQEAAALRAVEASSLDDGLRELDRVVHHVAAEGDLVAVHASVSGEHVAAVAVRDADGRLDRVLPPTGRRFAVQETQWVRLDEARRAVEHWTDRDDLGMA